MEDSSEQKNQGEPQMQQRQRGGKEVLSLDPFAATKQYQFLSRIFNKYIEPGQSESSYRQSIDEIRSTLLFWNLKICGYTRAHHYHFSLQDFPRVENQFSYAIDEQNSFGATFLLEEKEYLGQKLGDIINRKIFTLPDKDGERGCFLQRKFGESKNDAHKLLFSNEDAKYNMDRLILTIKKIRKNYAKISYPQKFKQFSLVANDGPLAFLLDEQLNHEKKKAFLDEMLISMQVAKKQKEQAVQINDFMYYPSSLQQKIHDAIIYEERIDDKLQSKMIVSYITKYKQARQSLKTEIYFSSTLKKMLCYYKSNVSAVSQQAVRKLIQYETVIKNENVKLPLVIMDFGSERLRDKVNTLIVNYLNVTEYGLGETVIRTVEKVMNCYLGDCQIYNEREFQEDKQLLKNVVVMMKERKGDHQNNEKCIIDDDIDYQKLTQFQQNNFEPFNLFQHGQYKIILTECQARAVIFYSRICKVLRVFEPFIYESEELMQVICSKYWENLYHGFIGNLKKKLIGKLAGYLKHFMISAAVGDSEQQGEKIEFQFNSQSGVGLLWHLEKEEEEQQDIDMQEAEQQMVEREQNKEKGEKKNEAEEIVGEELLWSMAVEHHSACVNLKQQPLKQCEGQEQVQKKQLAEIQGYPFTKKIKKDEQQSLKQ